MLRQFIAVTACMLALPTLSATTFYACVEKNGQVTMADASTTCKPGATKIQWNDQGPPGPQGPQGPVGPAGTSSPNPLKVALLRWYDVLQSPPIDIGTSTAFLAFDGENIWVSTG